MISVGIGEFVVTDQKDESLITHALGSCVAVIMRCSCSHVTAMAHVVLPRKSKFSNVDREAYYADETVHALLEYFTAQLGCPKEYLQVTLVGGADAMREDDSFCVGRRNLEAVRSVLKKRYVRFNEKDTGGRYSRTVVVDADTGKVHVRKMKMLL